MLIQKDPVDNAVRVTENLPCSLSGAPPDVKPKTGVLGRESKSVLRNKSTQMSRIPKTVLANLGNPVIKESSKRLWFVQETSRYLAALTRSVREVKRVDEASQFGRWLVMSGALDMLSELPQMAVEASRLRSEADCLVMACGDLYKSGKSHPKYSQGDIIEINQKLDLLMSQLAKPVLPQLPVDSQSGVPLRDSATLEAEHKLIHQNSNPKEPSFVSPEMSQAISCQRLTSVLYYIYE